MENKPVYTVENFTENGGTEADILIGYVDYRSQTYRTMWIPRSVCEISGTRLYVQQWWADKNKFLPER